MTARAAWLRWPDSTIQAIANRAGVSYETARQARPEEVVNTSPGIENSRGQVRPRTYAPREPQREPEQEPEEVAT